jgi:hypothetical protein
MIGLATTPSPGTGKPPTPARPPRCSRLGEQAIVGEGIPKDYGQAREWYQKAAEADEASPGTMPSIRLVPQSRATPGVGGLPEAFSTNSGSCVSHLLELVRLVCRFFQELFSLMFDVQKSIVFLPWCFYPASFHLVPGVKIVCDEACPFAFPSAWLLSSRHLL